MKSAKKLMAIILCILTIISISPAATSVFAAEYVEEQTRSDYFESALFSYFKNCIYR